jgi:hypothetical protein
MLRPADVILNVLPMTENSLALRISNCTPRDPHQLYGMSRKLKEIYQNKIEDGAMGIPYRKTTIIWDVN